MDKDLAVKLSSPLLRGVYDVSQLVLLRAPGGSTKEMSVMIDLVRADRPAELRGTANQQQQQQRPRGPCELGTDFVTSGFRRCKCPAGIRCKTMLSRCRTNLRLDESSRRRERNVQVFYAQLEADEKRGYTGRRRESFVG